MIRTPDQIAATFRQVYNGARNFMTPDLIKYGKRGRHLYELSKGRGISNAPIYGVTVITIDGEKCHDLSKMFYSYSDAVDYISADFSES